MMPNAEIARKVESRGLREPIASLKRLVGLHYFPLDTFVAINLIVLSAYRFIVHHCNWAPCVSFSRSRENSCSCMHVATEPFGARETLTNPPYECIVNSAMHCMH